MTSTDPHLSTSANADNESGSATDQARRPWLSLRLDGWMLIAGLCVLVMMAIGLGTYDPSAYDPDMTCTIDP